MSGFSMKFTERGAAATCDGDLCHRRLSVRRGTIDEANRSVEAIIATEAVVGAFSLATFEVIDEVLLMRGAVVPDSMPLIDTHDPTSVDKLRGRVRNIRIEGSNMIGRLFFGNTPAARDAWQDVLDGNLTDVSTGNEALATVVVPAGESARIEGRRFTASDHKPLHVRTRWRPRETSLTIIGADPESKILRSACQCGGVCGNCRAAAAGTPRRNALAETLSRGVLELGARRRAQGRYGDAHALVDDAARAIDMPTGDLFAVITGARGWSGDELDLMQVARQLDLDPDEVLAAADVEAGR